MARSFTLGIALVLLAQFSASAEFVPTGRSAEITTTWYACEKSGDLQFLKGLSSKQWWRAAGFAKTHHCKILHHGKILTVRDSSTWTHDTCLQLTDKKYCFWFPEIFVEVYESHN
jgi:hypothetical protein